MNVVVLGGKSNFGSYLVSHLEEEHTVLAVGRPEVDFTSGWLSVLKELVDAKFGSVDEVDLIVVNVFDKRPDHLDVQANVLSYVWSLFKDKPKVQVVALGSMEHYYTKTSVSQAKRRLRDYVFEHLSPNPEGARFLLLEPYVLGRETSKGKMGYETLASELLTLAQINKQFMAVSLKCTQ